MNARFLSILLNGIATALNGQPPAVIDRLGLETVTERKVWGIGYDFGEGMRKDLFIENDGEISLEGYSGSVGDLSATDYIDEAISQAEQCLLKSNPK